MEIEYLEEFRKLRERDTFKGEQWLGERKRLIGEYSWAVPNEQVIEYLAQFDEIIEVGAGTGYWAHLIEQAGGNVRATDKSPPSRQYVDVEEESVHDLNDDLRNNVVLMVWPPNGDGVARGALFYQPNHILYVGESFNGCTASDEFWDSMTKRYGLVERIDIPSYEGVADKFYHYARKV